MSISIVECMDVLREAGDGKRLAWIEYRKPTDRNPTTRLVEPYEFQFNGSNDMVFCWQAKPKTKYGDGWRTFRVDRILNAKVTDNIFKPRIDVMLTSGVSTQWEMDYTPDVEVETPPCKGYMVCIENAMLDGQVGSDEIENAKMFSIGLSTEEIRGVHAQVFSNILREMLVDSEIDDKEARYLVGVSAFLAKLGWVPGQ